MRISDWSSDVCSSDLRLGRRLRHGDFSGLPRWCRRFGRRWRRFNYWLRLRLGFWFRLGFWLRLRRRRWRLGLDLFHYCFWLWFRLRNNLGLRRRIRYFFRRRNFGLDRLGLRLGFRRLGNDIRPWRRIR